MDANYVNSPSSSHNGTMSHGQFIDSLSESSSPKSPHVYPMIFSNSLPYDVYNCGPAPTNLYPTSQASNISIEYISSPFDEGDRRKRRSTSSSKSPEKDSIPNMHLRRRAQNRASQRAFRERKEKHVKGLEHQLEELHEKHQDLLQSYSKQANEVSRLNARIADLTSQLGSLQSTQSPCFAELLVPGKFDKFDAFSSTEMMYSEPDGYFDKSTSLNPDLSLRSFEDSL